MDNRQSHHMQVRRAVLQGIGGLAALGALGARAQEKNDYPNRTVRIVNTAAVGGPYDLVARYAGEKLTRALHQSFVVDSLTGAGTTLGTAQALRAPADGYTLLVHSSSTLAISPLLYKDLSYEPAKDLAPVWALQSSGLILVVHPSLPVSSAEEFAQYAKANPGKVAFGSAGNGTVQHLAGELFMRQTGAQLVHAPYRGAAPAMNDLIAGHIACMFDAVSTAGPQVAAGKIKPLAAIRATRSPAMPDIPTAREAGIPGVELPVSNMGIWTRTGTPAEVVDRIAHVLATGFEADPEGQARMAGLGLGPIQATAEEMAQAFTEERAIFGDLVRDIGLEPQ